MADFMALTDFPRSFAVSCSGSDDAAYEGLSLDLPDTFASHLEVLSDFFERMVRSFTDAEPFPQDFFLPGRQRFQCAVDLRCKSYRIAASRRRHRLLVFDKVAQMAVFFFADRRLQRNRFARNL